MASTSECKVINLVLYHANFGAYSQTNYKCKYLVDTVQLAWQDPRSQFTVTMCKQCIKKSWEVPRERGRFGNTAFSTTVSVTRGPDQLWYEKCPSINLYLDKIVLTASELIQINFNSFTKEKHKWIFTNIQFNQAHFTIFFVWWKITTK